MMKLTVVVRRNFANAREEACTCTILLERGERHIMDVICWGYEPRAPTRLKSNYYYYYYYSIWMYLVTGLFFLVLLLNQL